MRLMIKKYCILFFLLFGSCGNKKESCQNNYINDTGICYKIIEHRITHDKLNILTNTILKRTSYYLNIDSSIIYKRFLNNKINLIVAPKENIPSLRNKKDSILGITSMVYYKYDNLISEINIGVRNDLKCFSYTYMHELLHVIYNVLYTSTAIKYGNNYHDELYFGLGNNSLEDKLYNEIGCF